LWPGYNCGEFAAVFPRALSALWLTIVALSWRSALKSVRFVSLLAILVSAQAPAQTNRAFFANRTNGAKLVQESNLGTRTSKATNRRSNGLQAQGLSFAAAVPYNSGGNGANAVAVADVNGDGKPDLVVTNWCAFSGCSVPGNNIGVLLGNGDGTFQRALVYASGGLFADSVAVADLNGDGKPDLVVANCGSNTNANCVSTSNSGNVGVLIGNGDGTFNPVVTYSTGGGGFGVTSVTVADLGNGKLDLIVAGDCAGGGCVGVLLGNGDGTFQTELTSNGSGGIAALSVAVADLGNGHPDAVVANQCTDNTCTSSTVSVLLGNGDGTFQTAVPYDSGGLFADWVAIADVSGDSKADVVVANSSTSSTIDQGNVAVLLGKGDGTLQTALVYASGGFGDASVAVADVNGDGNPDLVVGNCSSSSGSCNPAGGNVGVLLGNGDGTFRTAVTYGSGGNAPFAVAVGDVNGDSKPDIVAANCVSGNCGAGNGTVGVLTNTSAGTPAATFSPTSLTFPTQLVFTTSKAQPVKLTNTGDWVLLINKISVTGPFSKTNNCPSGLKPNASCIINLKFHPGTKGVLSGSVNVKDNAPGSPQKVSLAGTGTYVQLAPTTLNFGNQPVGTKSLPKKITLTNKGHGLVNITSLAVTGVDARDFAETNNCGHQVASGASCVIKVTFKPLKKGNRTADVSISDDGGGSPQKIGLMGTGT
jgi:hypothetical protein